MKIEKINDNQIRCTLTHNDLVARKLKLSELVCGTEKAKSLFHDMMQQAASEFGFEAEDTPLMIEAIPSSSDSIVLIITKVDDPEELDTKFSKFGISSDTERRKKSALDKLDGAENILDLIHKVKEAVSDTTSPLPETEEAEDTTSGIRLFSFGNLDCVIHACRALKQMYHGSNTLYKDTEDDAYILVLTQSDHSDMEFNRICNMFSEYGSYERVSGAVLAFLEEHCQVIVSKEAVQQLGTL